MVTATTTDPTVVAGVVLATAGAWLLAALLIRAALDQPHPYTPATHHTPTPALPTTRAERHPHARPAACDETQPITTVKVARARHRKGSSCS